MYFIVKLIFNFTSKINKFKKLQKLTHELIIRFEYNAIVELIIMEYTNVVAGTFF